MKKDELTALGLTDEQVSEVMKIHGLDIERHKSASATLTAERDELRTQLAAANEKLTGYDPDWRAKSEQATKDADARVAAVKMDYAIDAALQRAGARNAALVRGLVDKSKLVMDGESIIGLDAQIDALKKDEGTSFVFAQAIKPKMGILQGDGNSAAQTDNSAVNAAIREAFGRKE